jgi:hypothetical protein
MELSMLYSAYWEPKRRNGRDVLLSFSEVAEKSDLHENLGSEIYELHAAAGFVHADYVSAADRLNGRRWFEPSTCCKN